MADQPTYSDLQALRSKNGPTFADLQAARATTADQKEPDISLGKGIAETAGSMGKALIGAPSAVAQAVQHPIESAKDIVAGVKNIPRAEGELSREAIGGMSKDIQSAIQNPDIWQKILHGGRAVLGYPSALYNETVGIPYAQTIGTLANKGSGGYVSPEEASMLPGMAMGIKSAPVEKIPAAARSVADTAKNMGAKVKNAGVPEIDNSASDALYGTSQNLYKQAKTFGASYTPKLTDQLLDYAKTVQSAPPSVIKNLGTTPFDVFKDGLEKYRGQPFSLDEWHAIDKRLTQAKNNAFKSGDNEQAHHFDMLQDGLRDIIVKSANQPGMMVGPPGGIEALRAAQQTYAQSKKVEILEEIGKKAAMTQNPITATETALKNLLSGKKAGLFSPQEIKALEHAQKTGMLTEVLRRGSSRLIAPIASGAGAYAGGPMGAIVGNVAAQAITSVPRAAANAMKRAKVKKAIDLVAKPQPQLPTVPQTLQMPPGRP